MLMRLRLLRLLASRWAADAWFMIYHDDLPCTLPVAYSGNGYRKVCLDALKAPRWCSLLKTLSDSLLCPQGNGTPPSVRARVQGVKRNSDPTAADTPQPAARRASFRWQVTTPTTMPEGSKGTGNPPHIVQTSRSSHELKLPSKASSAAGRSLAVDLFFRRL